MDPSIRSLSDFSSLEFTISSGIAEKKNREEVINAKPLSFLRQKNDRPNSASDDKLFDQIFNQLLNNTGIDLGNSTQIEKIVSLIKASELGNLEFPTRNKDENYEDFNSRQLEFLQPFNIDSSRILDSLSGISGFSLMQFLKCFSGPDPLCKISGRIIDYLYLDEKDDDFQPHYPDIPGYNVSYGSGHLAVETLVEDFLSIDDLNSGNPATRILLHWHIEICSKGFRILTRQGDADSAPFEPFPHTVPFPEAATNPANKNSVWCRGLDHKMYAEGNSIVVKDVFRQINCGRVKRLNSSNHLYKVTPESCIDLMFRGYPSATELPLGGGYCLGRCPSPGPGIVNTNGE